MRWATHQAMALMASFSIGMPLSGMVAAWAGSVVPDILDQRKPAFEYEGEMAPDVALNEKVMKNYPFCRLSGPANVLIMPGLQSANLSAKLLRELGGGAVIGPMLVGMEKPVQVATMASTASDLVTLAVLAAGGIAR